MSRRTLFIGAALIAVVAGALFFGLRRQGEASSGGPAAAQDAAAPRAALTVSLTTPEPAELVVSLAANGTIAAWQEASVGAELNGLRLAEVRVNVGDVVNKGQVLAVFAGEAVQAELAQAKAALAEAEATAANAAGNAERARSLEKTDALSQQQINQYRTAAQTASARVQAARAALAAQQVRSRNIQVLAPDGGVISARSATVGSVVGAGMELFRLVRQGRLEWRAEINSADIGRIQPGIPAQVTAVSGEQTRGIVRAVAPTVDGQTRTGLVYVDLPQAMRSQGIKAGMFARGNFELGRSTAPMLPQAAVVVRDGFSYVMAVPEETGRVVQTKIETGRRVGDRVEITSPLPSGTRVVAQGGSFLNDGDLVKVVDAAKPADPTPRREAAALRLPPIDPPVRPKQRP